MEALTLAYALTSSQPWSLPVLNSHHIMLHSAICSTRRLRARRLVVLVGDPQAIAVAVGNDRVRRRYTALA